MQPNSKRSPSYQAGFTLIEIMVGMTIGLLATMVIMQVFSVFETQKRATTGTADAQTNGSIALYTIGRELKMAGYPLLPVTNSPLECITLTFGATGIGGIFPVTITDNVASPASASDTITIRYGDTASGGIPTQIQAWVNPTATVLNNFGCQVNDIAIAVNGTTCAMTRVAGMTGTTDITLEDATANAAGAAVSLADLACLGTWNEITYAVNNGNLERNGVPIVPAIVNLQAQYGISATAASNQVTQWVDASATAGWNAPSVDDRKRIKAVRIAVVAVNVKKEPAAVTAVCSSTTTAAPTGLCAWEGSVASPAPTINLSANDPDWLKYRYRVFETIIPLRNMIWSKDTL